VSGIVAVWERMGVAVFTLGAELQRNENEFFGNISWDLDEICILSVTRRLFDCD
jgi:hypothetical protein